MRGCAKPPKADLSRNEGASCLLNYARYCGIRLLYSLLIRLPPQTSNGRGEDSATYGISLTCRGKILNSERAFKSITDDTGSPRISFYSHPNFEQSHGSIDRAIRSAPYNGNLKRDYTIINPFARTAVTPP